MTSTVVGKSLMFHKLRDPIEQKFCWTGSQCIDLKHRAYTSMLIIIILIY